MPADLTSTEYQYRDYTTVVEDRFLLCVQGNTGGTVYVTESNIDDLMEDASDLPSAERQKIRDFHTEHSWFTRTFDHVHKRIVHTRIVGFAPDNLLGTSFQHPLRYSYKHLMCGHVDTFNNYMAYLIAQKPTAVENLSCGKCKASFPAGPKGDFIWVNCDPAGEGTLVGTLNQPVPA